MSIRMEAVGALDARPARAHRSVATRSVVDAQILLPSVSDLMLMVIGSERDDGFCDDIKNYWRVIGP